ncbi:AbrB/MazE/SpoVT family DNA-binding domain-containing protein [Natranaeroarchaeum aerophilus]|uniref:AbrB/MazE/SpoVT family DNA-binding domain-containing protein n=1 Tax=Natranaeroarchaeum aerophilus TaxID=2917711 RepID=A0AAE3K3E1_9EURY|nr:AbrB/MazE/SpoVT family DNA-binding domain-containing protein [Natranaeroarchaeum aerophilus]MCL9812428.1 AbrB/MazE/SpoVT family DNA-binding domain-containing protein [Natranaeroarchaeum aerophilus]
MSETTRITEKGQATIPKRLRDKYNLEPGDQVVWLEGEDGIVVRKRTQSGGRGLLAPDADADERAAIAERLSEGTREARDREYDLYE